MACHQHRLGVHRSAQGEPPLGGGIDHGRHIFWPQGQLRRTRRRLLAGQHGSLLALIAAWVAGQHHGVAMASQVGCPALEVAGVIPQPVGNHHQSIWRRSRSGWLEHHQSQRLRAMANDDF